MLQLPLSVADEPLFLEFELFFALLQVHFELGDLGFDLFLPALLSFEELFIFVHTQDLKKKI